MDVGEVERRSVHSLNAMNDSMFNFGGWAMLYDVFSLCWILESVAVRW